MVGFSISVTLLYKDLESTQAKTPVLGSLLCVIESVQQGKPTTEFQDNSDSCA
jgi:hypothetical protein